MSSGFNVKFCKSDFRVEFDRLKARLEPCLGVSRVEVNVCVQVSAGISSYPSISAWGEAVGRAVALWSVRVGSGRLGWVQVAVPDRFPRLDTAAHPTTFPNLN